MINNTTINFITGIYFLKFFLEISTYNWTQIETEDAARNYNFPQLPPNKFDQALYLSELKKIHQIK